MNSPLVKQHMAVGRGDVDGARIDGLPIAGMECRQVATALQDLRQCAGGIAGNMNRQQDRRRDIGFQRTHDLQQNLDPPARCADDHDVTALHRGLAFVGSQRSGCCIEFANHRHFCFTILFPFVMTPSNTVAPGVRTESQNSPGRVNSSGRVAMRPIGLLLRCLFEGLTERLFVVSAQTVPGQSLRRYLMPNHVRTKRLAHG